MKPQGVRRVIVDTWPAAGSVDTGKV